VDLNMDLECGEEPKVIHIKDNGNLANLKGMEFILGRMEINTRDNLKNV
jgi:hypothetical protein